LHAPDGNASRGCTRSTMRDLLFGRLGAEAQKKGRPKEKNFKISRGSFPSFFPKKEAERTRAGEPKHNRRPRSSFTKRSRCTGKCHVNERGGQGRTTRLRGLKSEKIFFGRRLGRSKGEGESGGGSGEKRGISLWDLRVGELGLTSPCLEGEKEKGKKKTIRVRKRENP